MATTTPNYGWTVPTSTDLVKDGATAIETLGDAIDASMNTALGTKKAGMVLLNTTSFSAVASQSFSNLFTSDFDYYSVIYNITYSSNVASGNFRFRDDTTDTSAANYEHQFGRVTSGGTLTFTTAAGQTSAIFHDGGLAAIETSGVFNIYCPSTSIKPKGINDESSLGGSFTQRNFAVFAYDSASTHNGFTIFPSTGNFTGQVSVFGVNK
jgi:hypothetical protein